VIPSVTAVRMTGARHRAELPLLVLGPSLGTSATALWSAAAAGLTDAFDVVAWDLPGHGHNRSVPDEAFTVAELTAGVLHVVDDLLAERGDVGGGFSYAGDSVGGAVGLQLMLDAPGRVTSAVLLGTGAQIGDPTSWAERAPADDTAYAAVCGALAAYDVRDRLAEIGVPVLAVAGAEDVATPPAKLREIAERVREGRYVELPGVTHLAPAEAPDAVARLIRGHVLGETGSAEGSVDDRSLAATTDFTRDSQELVTQHASGSIWARPGLDRRSRSLITLTALVARGHHEALQAHVRAARTNGLSEDEIRELLLQTAIYCGVPDASTAFRIAQRVMAEESGHPGSR